jgi:hypothetical protein
MTTQETPKRAPVPVPHPGYIAPDGTQFLCPEYKHVVLAGKLGDVTGGEGLMKAGWILINWSGQPVIRKNKYPSPEQWETLSQIRIVATPSLFSDTLGEWMGLQRESQSPFL